MPTTTLRRKFVTQGRVHEFLRTYYNRTNQSFLTAIRERRRDGLSLRDAMAALAIEGRHIDRQLRKMTRLA